MKTISHTPPIAIIIPALNEETAIAAVIADIPKFEPPAHIIVVDNGSTDSTVQIARQAGATVIAQPIRGYGHACLAGILHAKEAEVLIFLDGDYSDYPEEIPQILSPLLSNQADFVIGSRIKGHRLPGSMPFHQLLGNILFAWILNIRFQISISDIGPFRAIRRESLLKLNLTELTYGWTLEMIICAAQSRLRIVEVPVSYRPRLGYSKVSGTIPGSIRAAFGMFNTLKGCLQ